VLNARVCFQQLFISNDFVFCPAVAEATTAWHKWTAEKIQQKETNPQKSNRKPPPYKHVKVLYLCFCQFVFDLDYFVSFSV